MSVDRYLDRRYDREKYNCLHFARDVWADVTGVDISDLLANVFQPEDRKVSKELLAKFHRLERPESPCLVLMTGVMESHIGIFLRGNVLHIHEYGVEFLPLDVACRGFKNIRFYTC